MPSFRVWCHIDTNYSTILRASIVQGTVWCIIEAHSDELFFSLTLCHTIFYIQQGTSRSGMGYFVVLRVIDGIFGSLVLCGTPSRATLSNGSEYDLGRARARLSAPVEQTIQINQ